MTLRLPKSFKEFVAAANQRLKLTGASILVLRASKSFQAAPVSLAERSATGETLMDAFGVRCAVTRDP